MTVIDTNTKFQDGIFESMDIPFVQVSKYILLDSSLSNSAKGLYATIEMFYQKDKDLNQIDFYKCSCDDGSIIDSAWNELKEKGILQRFPIDNV